MSDKNKIKDMPLYKENRDKLDDKKFIENRDNIEKELSIISDALASTINGVIITDIEGKINYVNPAFLRMFEYSDNSDLIGTYAHELFVAKEVKSFSDVEAMIERLPGETEEFLAHQMDGTRFWVEVSSTTITDKENKIVGRMASFVDITGRRQVEEENRRLSSELMRFHEIERQRIAVDLHDSVAQTIHAAKLNLIAYQKNPEKYRERFKVGLDFIDKASQELREVSNDLYPSVLRDYGLSKTIQWYKKNYLELNGIKCVDKIDLDKKLQTDLEVNLYRIVRELFSNIIKHSKADAVTTEMFIKKGILYLIVEDNGIGFNYDDVMNNRKGFGMLNIQHRVNDLDGILSINTSSDKGTKITIEIGIN